MVSSANGAAVADRRRAAHTLRFEAADVTGTHRVIVEDVQASLPAGAVAKALASRMALPQSVPWALRSDATAAYLDDRRPIGEQIGPAENVTLAPKTHLGASRRP
jgi:hypothetical protein